CMPADAHALAWLPIADVGAKSINNPDDFMPGNSWILNARKDSFLNNRVAVTDATGLDFDSDRFRRRFWDFPLREFQRTLPASDLNDTHFRHVSLLRPSCFVYKSAREVQGSVAKAQFAIPSPPFVEMNDIIGVPKTKREHVYIAVRR